jgi:hypothetical protein
MLTTGDISRDGCYQIVDTRWDSNGTMFVAVRERYGVRVIDQSMLQAMRRLARRAVDHPEKTRSSKLVRTFYADSCSYATFAVSRLEG